MKLTFIPMRREDRLVLHRRGDVLTVNGEDFDFTPLPEGATLPREAIQCQWFAGRVERIGGVLHIALVLPHGPQAPESTRFPEPLVFDGDGAIPLPSWSRPEESVDVED